MKLVRRFLPLSGTALAALAWRNREEIADWAAFAVRGARSLVAEGGRATDDLRAEARLRAVLVRHRLRGGDHFDVLVRDGIAHLAGRADRRTADEAVRAANRVPGVRLVDTRDLAIG
jgi:osmotically-inducible protein OsmY